MIQIMKWEQIAKQKCIHNYYKHFNRFHKILCKIGTLQDLTSKLMIINSIQNLFKTLSLYQFFSMSINEDR